MNEHRCEKMKKYKKEYNDELLEFFLLTKRKLIISLGCYNYDIKREEQSIRELLITNCPWCGEVLK